MLTIGVRAHDFGTLSPDRLAAAVALPGVSCVQLALSKAVSGIETNPALLGPAGARAVRDAFYGRGVSIAVLGCYINPVHPDPAAREAALRRFEDHLRAAADFGCRIVGTETGSIEPDCSFHPDTAKESTFLTLVESIRRLARAAEETGSAGAVVGVEAVADTHTVSSAALMRRLLDDVGSPSVGVIFDPTNLVPKTGLVNQEALLDECFAAFGDRIVAVHAKDYRIEEGCCGPRKNHPLPAGSGELDWVGFFRRLRAAGKAQVPILLENAGPREAPGAIERLKAAWEASDR
jgi:sugar phosphate isomerase/epimerase